MTLDLLVYSKSKPKIGEVKKLLNIEKTLKEAKTDLLIWQPFNDTQIEIKFRNEPFIESREYHPDEIGKMYVQAQARGYNLPKELLAKFYADGQLLDAEIAYESKENPDYSSYVVRVDEELYGILSLYPYLPEALPSLSTAWEIARFSRGMPLNETELSIVMGSSEQEIECMANLASHIAKEYNGILWDPQTGTFGKPDAKKMSERGKEFVDAIIKSMKSCKGAEFMRKRHKK